MKRRIVTGTTLGEFASVAKVDVAAIDRRPARFYRDTVSPNKPNAHSCSRQPQGRGTGHAKHSPRAVVTFHRLISVKSVNVPLECTRRLTSPHISPEGRAAPFQRIRLWTCNILRCVCRLGLLAQSTGTTTIDQIDILIYLLLLVLECSCRYD